MDEQLNSYEHINIDEYRLMFSGHGSSLSKVIEDIPGDDKGREGLTSQYSNVEEPNKTEVAGVEQVDLAGKISKCVSFGFPFPDCNDIYANRFLGVNTGS